MTEKEFRSVFDKISCSRDFAERMEQKLASPPSPSEYFADCVSGVEVTRQSPIIRTSMGIAACLAFILIGFAAGTAFHGGIPSSPISPSTVTPIEDPTEQTTQNTEQPTEEPSTEEPEQILYPGKEIPQYDEFPMQDLSSLPEEELVKAGKKYFDAAYRLYEPDAAPPYLFFYAKKDELYVDENGLEYCEVVVDSVKTVADVREDFYSVFTSAWDSSVIDKHFAEKDGKLYYRCTNHLVSIYMSDYKLELETVTETEIAFSFIINQIDNSKPEPTTLETIRTPFVLRLTEDGWKVAEYTPPNQIYLEQYHQNP